MLLQYAVIQKSGVWALFRGGVELVSFPTVEQSFAMARAIAAAVSFRAGPVQLLLHDRFGELRPEWFSAGSCDLRPIQ